MEWVETVLKLMENEEVQFAFWVFWRIGLITFFVWASFTINDYIQFGKKDLSRMFRFIEAMIVSAITAYVYDYRQSGIPLYIVAWTWIPMGVLGFAMYVVFRKKIEKAVKETIPALFRLIGDLFRGLVGLVLRRK